MELIDCQHCFELHDQLTQLRSEFELAKKSFTVFKIHSEEREIIGEEENNRLLHDLKRAELEKEELARKLQATER